MYNIYKAIHHRMEKFLMAKTNLASNASSGTRVLNVDDATLFGFEGLNSNVPTIILQNDNTSGDLDDDGNLYSTEFAEVQSVDTDTNEIILLENLSSSWLTSDNATIQRAPGETVVQQVIIGDLAVVTDFPTVCVVPTNESLDWFTMPGGTKETVNIDFMIYTADGDTEDATEELMRLTSVVKWILMSNLHIQEKGTDSVYGVTSKAIVSNIDYGTIQKGSEFLKAAKLTWTADLYVLRDYMASNTVALYEGD